MLSKKALGRADLHMHTSASDGKPAVNDLLKFVSKCRPHLNVIAITDHDTLDASLWAYERRTFYAFDIIPGVEVSSRDGHVLALWVTQPIRKGLDLADTVAAIHEQDGLAIVAHPLHPFIPSHFSQGLRYLKHPQVLLNIGIDGLEVVNSGISGTGFNWLAGQLARKIGLAVTGGSDAHTLGAIGTGETLFQGYTAVDLRSALKSKSTLARGTSWSITDYVGYLRHEHKRKGMIFSGITNSSTLINR